MDGPNDQAVHRLSQKRRSDLHGDYIVFAWTSGIFKRQVMILLFDNLQPFSVAVCRVQTRLLSVAMRRDCSWTVKVASLEMLRSCLHEAAQYYVPGRWRPKVDEDWTDVWVNVRQCLDMAQARAYELNLFEEEETLAKLKKLLLRATMEVDKASVDRAGNVQVRCATEEYEPQEWSKYRARVGSYHSDDLRAAAIALGRLSSLLTTAGKETEVVQWVTLAVTQLETMY